MGMAASQVRLLALTAQMHNTEFKAQRIESEKIALATQEDDIYQKYCDALDASKIQVGQLSSLGTTVYVDANYSNTCGFNPDNVKQYSLIDNRNGYVIVPENVKETYEEFNNDKYSFAWAMMGMDANFGWDDQFNGCEVGIGIAQGDYDAEEYDGSTSLYMTEVERMVFEENCDSDPTLQAKYDDLVDSEGDDSISLSERQSLLDAFRDELYRKYGSEIFEYMILDKQGDPENPEVCPEFEGETWTGIQAEFKYYVNLWEQIHESGGCETIATEYQTGDQGTEWFNNMISSGLVSIKMLDTSNSKGWVETSISTSIGNNYLQQVTDDKLVKKAEAEYEHELKIINRKDTKFDTELKNLETTETSLKTEIDSIKQVKNDNIERTFGIFS